MSSILPASCSGGVVTSGGFPVPETVILSEGIGSSSGLLILDGAKRYYIALTSSDLDTTLEKLISVIEKAALALDSAVLAFTNAATGMGLIDGKPTGGAGSAVTPLAAANIALITSESIEITTQTTALQLLKTELETLKGQLK